MMNKHHFVVSELMGCNQPSYRQGWFIEHQTLTGTVAHGILQMFKFRFLGGGVGAHFYAPASTKYMSNMSYLTCWYHSLIDHDTLKWLAFLFLFRCILRVVETGIGIVQIQTMLDPTFNVWENKMAAYVDDVEGLSSKTISSNSTGFQLQKKRLRVTCIKTYFIQRRHEPLLLCCCRSITCQLWRVFTSAAFQGGRRERLCMLMCAPAKTNTVCTWQYA